MRDPKDLASVTPANLVPPALESGYLRVAVAQLHYSPAIFIEETSFLEQPFALEKLWARVPPTTAFREIAARRREFGKKMRDLYAKQLTLKLAAIIQQCSQWNCSLLVLPEYSVPPESITGLLAQCGVMTAVLGTHYVEPALTRSSFYADLGITGVSPGHAVAPIASAGSIVAAQLKLGRSKWEPDIRCGNVWSSTSIPSLGGRTLGVLICIDFLDTKNDVFAKVVQPNLKETSLLAVPSLTPSHTRKEFEADLRKEARRYGRPVAYANGAAGGGSTVYIEDANASGVFPHGIAALEAGEEGVVIVDVDVDLNRPRDSTATRLDHRAVARPVAASELIYMATEDGTTHHRCVTDLCLEPDLNTLIAAVQANAGRLESSAAAVGTRTSLRVLDLLAKADAIDDVERVRCRLRDVFLPPDVLPPTKLRDLMLKLAEDETSTWTGDADVGTFIAACRKELQAAKGTPL